MLREGDAETRPAAGWEELYGRLILQDGIAAIPLALYLYQGLLQLSAQQVWFAGVILAHKWDAELPSPRLPALAAATGVSVRTLQYLRASLCRAGLLEVQERYDAAGRRTANRYDFSGLFARLEAAIAADPAEPNDLEEGPGAPDPPPGSPRSFTARFGRVIARQGIAAVPQALFTHQAALGLAPQHAWFVAYILGRRWTAGLPHPSLRRMAQRTGYSERQIHNLKDELVRRGFLRLVHRHGAGGGQDTNGYDFSGLLAAIQVELSGGSNKPAGTPAPPQPPAVMAIPEAALPPRRGRRTAAAAQTAPAATLAVQQDSVGPVQAGSPGAAQDSAVPQVQPNTVGPVQRGSPGPVQESSVGRLHPGKMAPVQLDSVGGVQGTAVGPVPVGSAGSVQAASEGATPFGGAHAAGFGGAGAAAFPGGGASRFRRREAERQESEQESDSNRSAPEEAGQGTTTASRLAAGGAPPYSPYVAGVILDHSRELGDDRHGPANVSQALRLWQTSGLDDAAFVALLHETRRRVRLAQGQHGPGGLLNKMAYYFRVLEDLARGEAPGP